MNLNYFRILIYNLFVFSAYPYSLSIVNDGLNRPFTGNAYLLYQNAYKTFEIP